MAILAVLDGCEKDEGADTKLEDEKLRRLEERLRKRKARPPVYVAREQVRKAIKVTEKEEEGAAGRPGHGAPGAGGCKG